MKLSVVYRIALCLDRSLFGFVSNDLNRLVRLWHSFSVMLCESLGTVLVCLVGEFG